MSWTWDIEYEIIEWLTCVKNNLDEELYIWDRVVLIEDTKKQVYTIYSYTTYSTHIWYTLWNWEDYNVYERWQFEKYNPQPSIWLNVSAEK